MHAQFWCGLPFLVSLGIIWYSCKYRKLVEVSRLRASKVLQGWALYYQKANIELPQLGLNFKLKILLTESLMRVISSGRFTKLFYCHMSSLTFQHNDVFWLVHFSSSPGISIMDWWILVLLCISYWSSKSFQTYLASDVLCQCQLCICCT